MSFKELIQHGTIEFPFALYEIKENSPKYEMVFHYHKNLEIIYVKKGKLNLSLNYDQFTVEKGQMVLANCGVIHGATPINCEYDCLVFDIEFLKTGNVFGDNFIDNLTAQNTLIDRLVVNPKQVEILKSAFSEMAHKKEGYQFKVIGLINQFLGEVCQTKNYGFTESGLPVKHERNDLRLKRVLSFIQSNYERDITIEDMAEAAELSPNYFCSFFKQTTDKTPIAYLTSYRIEQAAKQLLDSNLTVTQIAYGIGFNDLSYFIKTFKALKNCTPSVYRKRSK